MDGRCAEVHFESADDVERAIDAFDDREFEVPGRARASTCACFAERRDVVERAGVDRGVTRASGTPMTAAGGREAAAAAAVAAAAAAQP